MKRVFFFVFLCLCLIRIIAILLSVGFADMSIIIDGAVVMIALVYVKFYERGMAVPNRNCKMEFLPLVVKNSGKVLKHFDA